MPAKVKEKFQLLQKDEIKCRELITNFKKTLKLWFINGMVDYAILNEVINSCVEIILHGLKIQSEKLQSKTTNYESSTTFSNTKNSHCYKNDENKLNELQKLIDDFEWVSNAIRRNSNNTPWEEQKLPPTSSLCRCYSPKQFQRQCSQSSVAAQWLRNNLNEQNLCAFLQYLLSDEEFLEVHYSEKAFLRNEKYVSALTLGLTAFKTKQCGLLCQFEAILKEDVMEVKQHRRSNSQPNVILVPKTESNVSLLKQNAITSVNQQCDKVALTTIRKTQSLPEFMHKCSDVKDATDGTNPKWLRFKTIGTLNNRKTSPQKITKVKNQNLKLKDLPSSTFKYDNDDIQPSTSQASSNRSKSSLSNYTFNSNKSATSSLMSTSVSSCNSNNTTKCIQLFNTDNIKIWTDHSWELQQKCQQQQKQFQTTASCAIPTPTPPPIPANTKSSKSVSPFNSFFYSLFNTPPSYTSWFIEHDLQTENETAETAIESILPETNTIRNSILSSQQHSPLTLGSTVFDKFLPIDGKKVRARTTQNLFDDVNPALDCLPINTELPSTASSSLSTSANSKNCQSLTKFLQMSHLSRNDTDLEKENAHFRISEAIISAIEHIKWNKLETQKHKSFHEATPLATDCLASPDPLQSSVQTIPSNIIDGEHIPYAELEEVSYDLLSAEVVGLSLISKFDEKHMPKVSELKWLVSDDDTPQNLLPMPDLSCSANPDENVIHSATRGTRYWAPPRQQIIFTDHPAPKRKELLKLQNYRCAGCGMRVSSQYMQSFRYCTYLGKYHCTGCHRNQISATPAKILQSWDFKCYPVSVFAYRLLEQMYNYPLFYVPDLNPALYVRCNSLLTARNKRLQLKYVKDFVRMCRFALREQSYFESIPDYITGDIDNWSMSDFVDARTKCLHRSIDELIKKCETHIFSCVLCTARGFLCEHCHVDDIIYPWESRAERCNSCGTCFHRNCWKSISEKCCRCKRFDKRHNELNDLI